MNLASSNITQLLIPVATLDRAVSFYRDTLGLRLLFTAPPQMAFFQCGSVRLLVGVASGPHAAARVPGIYFEVADIHAAFQTLKGQGVVFDGDPHVVHRTPETELWLAAFKDPDANQLLLMANHPTPKP
jgi:methylmalonyl-CoA/ethylmalonyl-CoA epimerase